jgi:hypothetical protein
MLATRFLYDCVAECFVSYITALGDNALLPEDLRVPLLAPLRSLSYGG